MTDDKSLNKNKIMFKNISIGEIISFLMGIFILAPIITIKITGVHISVFNIIFILFFVYMVTTTLLSKQNIKLGQISKLYAIWFYMAIISSLFGLMYFAGMSDWTNNVIGYMPKIVAYLLLLTMLSMSKNKEKLIYSFFYGFLIGCVMNISWAVIEGFVYYGAGYSISNRIFADYISTLPENRQFISIIRAGGIRVAGFNYDPAHLGGILPIVVLYSLINKNYYLIVISIIALVFSQSTTALVSIVLLLVINYKKLGLKVKKKVQVKLVITTLTISMLLAISVPFLQGSLLHQSIQLNTSGFIDRVSTVYINNEDPGTRELYHLYTPLAVSFSGVKVLTGTGFGTASYPFVFSSEISSALGKSKIWPYDPESTYLSYLFNVGVIGLIIYLIILFKNYKYFSKRYYRKMDSLIFASLGGIIFSGFFYHYTLTAYQVIILIMSTVLMDMNKRKESGDLKWQKKQKV